MMDPVFFPFSHVDSTQQQTLTAFFSHVLFLPLAADLEEDPQMVPWVESHAATPVFTPSARLAEVASQVEAWLTWAKLHQGNEQNLKNLLRGNSYFTDDPGPTAIQSELRARMVRAAAENRGQQSSREGDPLLFLKIAKITDARNEAVDLALAGLERKRTVLFSRLRGDMDRDALDSTLGPSYRDPGDTMTRERIYAWAACAREEKLFLRKEPLVLVTTSRAVFDTVAAISDQAINALDIESIKMHENGCENRPEWQRRVLDILDKLVSDPGSVDAAQVRSDLLASGDGSWVAGRIQAGVFSGPDLEKQLNLPGSPVVVCRVTIEPLKSLILIKNML